tara:strand:+ start:307 stop:741 length:435 start_codon:yes stop_codon:yes gene_type:complete
VYNDFIPVIVFVLIGVALLVAPLVLQYLLSPRHNKSGEKLVSYECGEVPEGSAWVKFNVRFYIIALIFIIFDVEVVFLFPWAAVYQQFIEQGDGLLVLIEVLLFILILLVGFAYVWVKGDLDWVKMKLKYAHGRYSDLSVKKEN